MELKKSEEVLLEKFYRELFIYLESKGKLSKNSVLISFIKMNSNSRFESFDKSSLKEDLEDESLLDTLLKKGLIRKREKFGEYVITALGVDFIESKSLSKDYFIKFIDEVYFNLFKERPLNLKEKIILLSMISVRSFSKDSSIKSTKPNIMLEKLDEVFNLCYQELKKLGIASEKDEDKKGYYGGFKNERKITGVFRRLTDLPKKTKGIYSSGGGYYLSVYKDGFLDTEKISFLLNLIFSGAKLETSLLEELYNFLCKTSTDYSIFLFDSNERKFSNPKYDSDIRNAIYGLF